MQGCRIPGVYLGSVHLGRTLKEIPVINSHWLKKYLFQVLMKIPCFLSHMSKIKYLLGCGIDRVQVAHSGLSSKFTFNIYPGAQLEHLSVKCHHSYYWGSRLTSVLTASGSKSIFIFECLTFRVPFQGSLPSRIQLKLSICLKRSDWLAIEGRGF